MHMDIHTLHVGSCAWSGATESSRCYLGTYSSSSWTTYKCPSCPQGKYSNTKNAYSCISCDAGMAFRIPVAAYCTHSSALTGHYQNKTGQTKCLQCAAGKYAYKNGTSLCTKCSPGKYSNTNATTNCTACRFVVYVHDH
jgi:hypothetical protein